jgi:hypothetical protein
MPKLNSVSSSSRQSIGRMLAVASLAILVGYAGWAYLDRRGFARAVRADAGRRGYDIERIRHPSSWPLEYYEPMLDGVTDPAAAESLVDEDSTWYFIVPMAGEGKDSALVQVFHFSLDRWPAAIQLTYRNRGAPATDAGDWIPQARWRRDRPAAQEWSNHHRAGTGE